MANAGHEVVIQGDADGVNLQAEGRKGREKRRGEEEEDQSRVGKSRVRKRDGLQSRMQGHSSEREPGLQ